MLKEMMYSGFLVERHENEIHKTVELVRYHNILNGLDLGSFTSAELNLMFYILLKIRDRGFSEVSVNIKELKSWGFWSKRSYIELHHFIAEFITKIGGLKIYIDNYQTLSIFMVFDEIKLNKKDNTLNVSVSQKAYPYLNNITSQYTQFTFKEFLDIKSVYSKQLYRFIKQWNSVGAITVPINKLYLMLGLPTKYAFYNVMSKIFPSIERDLSPIFKNFNIEVNRKGRTPVSVTFSWKSQEKTDIDPVIKKVYREGILKGYSKAKKGK